MRKFFFLGALVILAVGLCGAASAAVLRISGQVFFDSLGTEEAPCCLVTLWDGSGCIGNMKGSTTTDGCGNYSIQFVGDAGYYYLKTQFQTLGCAAWHGYGTCPATQKCQDVTVGTDTHWDVYLGLNACYNSDCP
jgi:hypothetical protein